MNANHIILIGKGEGWEEAPRDTGVSCWGINDLVLRRPVDMLWHMHDLSGYRAWLPEMAASGPWHWWDLMVMMTLREVGVQNIPLMTLERYSHLPTSIPYPRDEILARFGEDYFGSAVDYMIAYALYTGRTRIDLYGINQVHGREYAFQRPSTSYWLGVARGMGAEYRIFGPSQLLRTRDDRMYGYGMEQKRCRSGRVYPAR